MEGTLDGQRVLITGAACGIGAAAAARLAAAGARIAGVDVRPGAGLLCADVSDRAQARAVVDAAVRRLGGLDVLVNNAGIGAPQDAGAFPDDEAHWILQVNFFGAWNMTAAAMPHLLESCGHVVNIVSGLALVDFPFAAAYSASKRALEAYSNILRLEYEGRITVSTVYPGYVPTGIHRRATSLGAGLEGLARPETLDQAASAVARACAGRPERVALTRRSAVEYWFARHLPGLTARVLGRRLRAALAARPRPAFLRFPEVRS